MVVLLGLFLCHANTVKVIWQFSSFTGGGRPQMPLHVLFHAQAGTYTITLFMHMNILSTVTPGAGPILTLGLLFHQP